MADPKTPKQDQSNPPPAVPEKAETVHVMDTKGRILTTEMTAADAAKRVKRMVAKLDESGRVVKDNDGNPIAVPQPIKESEVMSFADYGDRVVVVTTSGEKLEAPK